MPEPSPIELLLAISSATERAAFNFPDFYEANEVTTHDLKPNFAKESLLCKSAISSKLIGTSEAAGWTSALLEHHQVVPSEIPFDTCPTLDQTIVVMTRGVQTIESYRNGLWRRATYQVGTIGTTRAGEVDRLRRRTQGNLTPFEKVNLYIPQQLLQETAEYYRRAGCERTDSALTALAFNDPVIAQTVFAMVRASASGAPDLYAQTATQWLAAHLLTAHASCFNLQENRRKPGLITDRRLARIIEFMSANFAQPLTLEVLASEANVSKFHFVRLFRKCTGSTPHAFLIEIRLENARRLLATTDLSIDQVSANCGFNRHAHFCTAFLKRFRLTPSAFRQDAATFDNTA